MKSLVLLPFATEAADPFGEGSRVAFPRVEVSLSLGRMYGRLVVSDMSAWILPGFHATVASACLVDGLSRGPEQNQAPNTGRSPH